MKRFLIIVLALSMVVALLPMGTLATEEIPVQIDDYYEIYNADQLYWFAQQVNAGNTAINGKLMTDIVVNENVLTNDGELNEDATNLREWIPIGNMDNPFTGTFNGNGKSISGLYFNNKNADMVGLFGCIGSGIVRDLGVLDSYFHGRYTVGGIVGESNNRIENCFSSSRIIGETDVAGIVGLLRNWDKKSIVINCYNTGTVSGNRSVAGVVGCCDLYATVTDCYNSGSITAALDNYLAGGVVGWSNSGTIQRCFNTGTVSGGWSVGGVTGENYGGLVDNCYNTGSVNGVNYVGGIVGEAMHGTISNCYNAGDVHQSFLYASGHKTIYLSIDSSITPYVRAWDGIDSYEYRPGNGLEHDGDLWRFQVTASCYGLWIGNVNGYNSTPDIALEGTSDCLITVSSDLSEASVSYEGFTTGDGIKVIEGCAILGVVSYGTSNISNCYYLQESTPFSNDYGTAKTLNDFLYGEVAYLLQKQQEEPVWGQIIGKDPYPVFSDANVYSVMDGDTILGYSNVDGQLSELSSSLAGTITSFLSSDSVSVELLQNGEVAYSTTTSGVYSIENISMGLYTLRINKNNHTTREFEILILNGETVFNSTLLPAGDVTGDGNVNIKDYQRLLRHVNKTAPLSDYALACGDVTGDGVCNIKDLQRMLRHVNKTNPLFE